MDGSYRKLDPIPDRLSVRKITVSPKKEEEKGSITFGLKKVFILV